MYTIENIQKNIGLEIARKAFDLGAIRLNTSEPYRWASGYRMPIYNDNRLLLRDPEARALIRDGFAALIEVLEIDAQEVSGTATAGIPHAATLADYLELPLTYVRSSSKDHGLKNRIEGLGPGGDFSGRTVVLLEDLISTGGSSIDAVKALREAGANVPYLLAIFTYSLDASRENFARLDPVCRPISLLTYELMIGGATSLGYIDAEQAALLTAWRSDPFGWGAACGFPREKE